MARIIPMDCSAGFVYSGVDVRIPMLNGMIPLLVLVGPTSVGKTELSLHLAARLGAEIVSADSRYLYRGLDIGTAKPGRTELARIPHHLVDVTAPDQPWSLAEYKRAAVAAIEDIYARGRLPLLVGGTGQYVRALLEGWQIPAGGRARRCPQSPPPPHVCIPPTTMAGLERLRPPDDAECAPALRAPAWPCLYPARGTNSANLPRQFLRPNAQPGADLAPFCPH